MSYYYYSVFTFVYFLNSGINMNFSCRTKSRRLNSSPVRLDLQIAGCRKYRDRFVATTLERLSPCGIQGSREVQRRKSHPGIGRESDRELHPALLHLIIGNVAPKRQSSREKWQEGHLRVIARNKFVTHPGQKGDEMMRGWKSSDEDPESDTFRVIRLCSPQTLLLFAPFPGDAREEREPKKSDELSGGAFA